MKFRTPVARSTGAIICASLVCMLPVYGQTGGELTVESTTKVRPRAGGRNTSLADYLKLDSEQRKKLDPLIREEQEKLAKVKEEALQKAATVRSETDDEIRKILTPEQRRKFDEMRQRKRELIRKRAVTEKMKKQ